MREELQVLRTAMAAAEADPRLDAVHPDQRASARNLLHYLVLRRRDLRPLQRRLTALGLSSLGRAEAHVLATVDAVLDVLSRLSGEAPPRASSGIGFEAGPAQLEAHADALLGPAPPERATRIMVTMPSEAATDYDLVRGLVEQGMDVMRINGAHDNAEAWSRMVAHLRRAEDETGRRCRVVMDLGGPKIRTGPLAPGPRVVRIKPRRDALERVVAPARVWLGTVPPPTPGAPWLPVPAAWCADLREGERLRLTDARGRTRRFTVVEQARSGWWAETERTAYVVPGTRIRRAVPRGDLAEARVGALPAREAALRLYKDDVLLLTPDLTPGQALPSSAAAEHGTEDRSIVDRDAARGKATARIGCTLPAALADVRPGEPVWFDDGKIGGLVELATPEGLYIRVRLVQPGGRKLRADKGINFPESELRLRALTDADRAVLPFAVRHADAVALSFVMAPADVVRLQELLAEHAAEAGRVAPAVILKIETRLGFERLPALLLAAMRAPRCGVMIARGDLAVECGFERLAEVQEEVLWLCEAAHVPAIWATQVLEGLAKDGLPSRAEITDAAMGHRAECVMLNKGPHVRRAVRTLDDILRRMQTHQDKKRAMLRELGLARTP